MASSEASMARGINVQRSIDHARDERVNAAKKGLVILPSVDGPYVFDPVADKVVGRKGSEEYKSAVSSESEPMSRVRFLELQSAAESLGMDHAQGRILPGHNERVQQISDLMNASPWTLHPDHGCVLSSEIESPATASVEFESVWDEGTVTTHAILNLQTGEVTDIETSDEGEEYEHLQYEEIRDVGRGVSAIVVANEQNQYFLEDLSMLSQFGGRELAAQQPTSQNRQRP